MSMHRSTHTIGLAVALLLAGCSKPATTSRPAPTPPPTFVEAEPEPSNESTGLDRLSVVFPEGLVIELHAEPLALGGGNWGFVLELEFYNRLASGEVLDLGPDPLVVFSISVTLPDGSGFGTGGGCTYGTSLHGRKEQELGPGERYGSLQRWESGVETGQVLEADIQLCHVQLPDGRSLSGKIAKIEAKVDGEGKLASFELKSVALPQPRD
jgi:hypothetical protein